ncbi:hypothetical protein [Paenibacillus senegalensis]|uniref:hypothetical protein n=1 Tax=Paenibacillus senegalensis TaxID=1465766 RepID=UPI000289D5F5|nr:hypothetical protein [Paenibacillus senegalensis]
METTGFSKSDHLFDREKEKKNVMSDDENGDHLKSSDLIMHRLNQVLEAQQLYFQLTLAQSRLNSLKDELRRKRENNKQLDDKIKKNKVELKTIIKKNKNLLSLKQNTDRMYQEMLNSKSWRYTEYLRRLKSKVFAREGADNE